MPQVYSNPERANDTYASPDVEVFELNAAEVAELDEDTIAEYLRRYEFRLANMSGHVWQKMLDTIVEEQGIKGGWFYWYCFPGCLPEGDPVGPYETYDEALQAVRDDAEF